MTSQYGRCRPRYWLVGLALLPGCGDPGGPGRVAPGVIAYTVLVRGPQSSDLDIYVARSDGRRQQPLVARSNDDGFPVWSRDGASIAFLSWTGHTRVWDVSVARRDGGGVRQVLAAGVHSEQPPTWSPDGGRLAFTCLDDAGGWQVCSVGVGGVGRRQVTAGPGDCLPVAPVWSPQGGRLAYACYGSGEQGGIYVIDEDGSGRRRLTPDILDVFSLAWSPDGQDLAVIGRRALVNPEGVELLVVRADGSGVTPIPATLAVEPYNGVTWSPDGRWLAFGGGAFGVEELPHARIYVVARDGSGLRAITPDTLHAMYPTWSPAGP